MCRQIHTEVLKHRRIEHKKWNNSFTAHRRVKVVPQKVFKLHLSHYNISLGKLLLTVGCRDKQMYIHVLLKVQFPPPPPNPPSHCFSYHNRNTIYTCTCTCTCCVRQSSGSQSFKSAKLTTIPFPSASVSSCWANSFAVPVWVP